jgi:hypothetical protein
VTYSTQDIGFAVAMMYVFGEEVLYEIEVPEKKGGAEFCLRIPPTDAGRYRKDFDSGELAISDLKSFLKMFSWVSGTLRDMRKQGQHLWSSTN